MDMEFSCRRNAEILGGQKEMAQPFLFGRLELRTRILRTQGFFCFFFSMLGSFPLYF